MEIGPEFDIFAGKTDEAAVCVECVRGIANAQQRMVELAICKPGRYFVFAVKTKVVLARIDTTPLDTHQRIAGAA